MSEETSIRPSARPADRLLFQPVSDRYGMRLPLVFGNQAPGGQCPYYAAGKCRHCDIGAGEGARFTSELNRQRLVWFQDHYREVLPEVRHLVLYNSGSLLNPREMPASLLDEILAWTRTLPDLQVVSLETREAMATQDSVRRVAEAVGIGRTMRLVVGLETSDDQLRNQVLAKNMPRSAIDRMVDAVRSVSNDLGHDRAGLTFNILIGGPGTTPKNVFDDALATARFALGIGRDAGLSVDLNLHPYYRSARGREYFPVQARCSPRAVAAVASAVVRLASSSPPRSGLYIGIEDEGHDHDFSTPDWRADTVHRAIEEFNRTQDASVLECL